jgi:hypothetical protein
LIQILNLDFPTSTTRCSITRSNESCSQQALIRVYDDAGKVKKRKKSVSKWFRDDYGHTPLSANEAVSSYRLFGAGLYPAWIASCSVIYLPFFVVP